MLKVTILITAYNVARFIERTIESALAQDYADANVLIIDDASTDDTAKILQKYVDRIEIRRLPSNVGVLRATIEGLRIADGDVICFLDGDDTWDRSKVAEVVRKYSDDDSCALVSHDYRIIDQNDAVLVEDDPSQDLLKRLSKEELSAAMRASILEYRGNVWLGSGYSIRASQLDLSEFDRCVHAFPNPELLYQDHPLATFVVLTSAGTLEYVSKKLLNYRVHSWNHSGGSSDDAERGRRIVRKSVETHRATEELLRRYAPHRRTERGVQRVKTSEVEFIEALYSRRIPDAARMYGVAFSSWTLTRRIKESARFLVVAILGVRAFFWLKRLRTQGRRRS